MCSYCGCRALPEIAALNEQHDQIVNASGDLRRATDAGTDGVAPLADLVRLLAQHLDREERGLFTELRHHDDIRAHVDELCDEHDELQMMLTDIGDRQDADPVAVGRLVTFLRRHIDREENGLFPAAAISMDGAEWDAIAARID
jgi:hemerythrin-like domain-containing protein